jgi:RNA polymerase sigma-70 factor, ECF subfamily
MVDTHVGFVARVLRNCGTPAADVDDEVQVTFIVAARRLRDIHPGAERSYLFRIAANRAAYARRTAARRREVVGGAVPELVESLATPEALTDQKQLRELLDRTLAQMDDSLRAPLVFHEVEGMTITEIAGALRIPTGTAASRLRRARCVFRERMQATAGFWDLDPAGRGPVTPAALDD